MRLIFATNNLHKLSEIKDILGNRYIDFVSSQRDFGVNADPEENGKSFAENAIIKANALYDILSDKKLLEDNDYIIADDTGLCIDYLDGAPGIFSARFMGEKTKQEDKNNHILELMEKVTDEKRTAYFITNLAVIKHYNGAKCDPMIFEGRVDGYIARRIEKDAGFGYDPIFAVGNPSDIANGRVNTYSNMGIENKNKVSHRARAIAEFVQYLENSHNI